MVGIGVNAGIGGQLGSLYYYLCVVLEVPESYFKWCVKKPSGACTCLGNVGWSCVSYELKGQSGGGGRQGGHEVWSWTVFLLWSDGPDCLPRYCSALIHLPHSVLFLSSGLSWLQTPPQVGQRSRYSQAVSTKWHHNNEQASCFHVRCFFWHMTITPFYDSMKVFLTCKRFNFLLIHSET